MNIGLDTYLGGYNYMESNLKLYDTDIWKKYKELAPGDEYDDRRRRVGILGNRINDLSIQECEVLMISASLHDVGMSYTPEQEVAVFKDTHYIKRFLEEHYPGEYELDPDNWTAGMKQNYKRYLHPCHLPCWDNSIPLSNRSYWSYLYQQIRSGCS